MKTLTTALVITLIPMGYVIYQFWKATLTGLGMLTWFMQNTKEPELQKVLALSLFITYGISCFSAIRGQFAGSNNIGWSIVILYVILTLSFGYFRFMKFRVS